MKKLILSIILFFSFLSLASAQLNSVNGWDNNGMTILNDDLNLISNEVNQANTQLSSATTTAKTRYVYFVVSSALTTGTDKVGRIYIDFAGTATDAYACVSTAPTGASLIATLNQNGGSIGTPTITAGNYTSDTSLSVAFSKGDYFTLDITQVGSSVAGSNLVVRLTLVGS